MVLLTAYANHGDGEEQKRQQCETGKHSASCASKVEDVQFKRGKVSAIRDFPNGFEELDAQTTWIRDKFFGSVGSIGNLLGKKDSVDDTEDYTVEHFEIDVGSQQNSVHSEMQGLSNNLESTVKRIVGSDVKKVLELDVEFPKTLEDAKRRKVSSVRDFPKGSVDAIGNLLGKKDSADDTDDDFVEPFEIDVGSQQNSIHSEMQGLSSNLESKVERIVGSDPKEVLELDVESPKTQGMDGSNSLEMRPGTLPRNYFPQRSVSAIRCFPPGCGRHVAHLSKEDCLKALAASKNKGLGHHKSINYEEEVEGKQGKESLTVMEGSDRKLSGASAHRNQLQVEHPIGSEPPAGRVVVQALMAGPRCPWRQSKRALKANSTGYSQSLIGKRKKALT